MFNNRLKQELLALRQELSSLVQVKESLDREMLASPWMPMDGFNRSIRISSTRCATRART